MAEAVGRNPPPTPPQAHAEPPPSGPVPRVSGLNGLQALKLMEKIDGICQQVKIVVVCTIHQPSKPLFRVFSHVVLLCQGGNLAYCGPVGDACRTLIQHLESIPEIAPMKVYGQP